MQTFLPDPSFAESARVLDNKRLGKQRIECKQILNAIVNGGGWARHPAVRMWIGYEGALIKYYNVIVTEWKYRGYKHNMKLGPLVRGRDQWDPPMPPWLGLEVFHKSHKSKLISKYPEHYSLIWPTVSDQLPYFWPVDKEGNLDPIVTDSMYRDLTKTPDEWL